MAIWNNLEEAKLVASIATPFLIAALGIIVNWRIGRLERRHKLRIQFNIDANFIGVQEKYCVAEIMSSIENQGFTQLKLDTIRLKVKSIQAGEDIELFQKNYKTEHSDSIAKFSEEYLINTNMLARLIKKKKGEQEKVTHFIEPGVIQRFTYAAAIPKDIKFILVTASFKYHKKSEHTVRRIFAIKNENLNKEKSAA